jgi:hypothetical protein
MVSSPVTNARRHRAEALEIKRLRLSEFGFQSEAAVLRL